MVYKINSSASALGLRDGKDAYLLDREKVNPFDPTDEYSSYMAYNTYWGIGYREERDKV